MYSACIGYQCVFDQIQSQIHCASELSSRGSGNSNTLCDRRWISLVFLVFGAGDGDLFQRISADLFCTT